MLTRIVSTRTTVLSVAAVALLWHFASSPAQAATEIESIMVSPDTTVIFGNLTIRDEEVFADDLGGMRVPISLGSLPDSVAVDAFHDPGDGTLLFSIDGWAELDGLTVNPADVVLWDGTQHSIAFDARSAGVPPGVDLDALTLIDGELALSFDVGVDLPGGPFFDSDLILWDGAAFWLSFSGPGSGLAAGIDLDGAHRLDNGHFLLSFDAGGSIDGVVFADEDILEHDPATATWELIFDGSAAHPSWVETDLDALSVGERREIVEIPTLSTYALFFLVVILAVAGAILARRRRLLAPIS